MRNLSLIILAITVAIFAPRLVFAQSGTAAKGCIIYKPGQSAVPLVDEFVSFVDHGTNITIKTVSGDTIRVFQGQNPIAVPYPSDETATQESAASALLKARAALPRSAKRWDAIAAMWAAKSAVPVKPVGNALTTPAKGPSPSTQNTPNTAKIVKLLSGRELVNPVIQSQNDLAVRISHADGIGTYQWSEFSKEDQLAFGYVSEEAMARIEDAKKRAIADAEAKKLALQKERANLIETVKKRVKQGNVTFAELVDALKHASKFKGFTCFDSAKEMFGLPDAQSENFGNSILGGEYKMTYFDYRRICFNPNTGKYSTISLVILRGEKGEESEVFLKSYDLGKREVIATSYDFLK